MQVIPHKILCIIMNISRQVPRAPSPGRKVPKPLGPASLDGRGDEAVLVHFIILVVEDDEPLFALRVLLAVLESVVDSYDEIIFFFSLSVNTRVDT